jgi:hypothetical protein
MRRILCCIFRHDICYIIEIQRYQKTITSDKGVSQLDIADISTIKRLIDSVKPPSNGPNRTLDLNTKGGVIQQKQSLLTKIPSETVTMKSLGDKESETALGAKEKGNTVVREQVPIKANLDAISGSINTNKSKVTAVNKISYVRPAGAKLRLLPICIACAALMLNGCTTPIVKEGDAPPAAEYVRWLPKEYRAPVEAQLPRPKELWWRDFQSEELNQIVGNRTENESLKDSLLMLERIINNSN